MEHRDCNSSKKGAAESVASGKWPRFTTPPRRGWQSLHWSGVAKSHRIAVDVISSSNVNVEGARRSHYLSGCVSVFGHKTACVFALVFSVFLVT